VFGTNRYPRWARLHYGRVAFDLASSGIPSADLRELGVSPPSLDDASAYEALRGSIAHYNDVPAAEVAPALGTTQALFLAYAALLSPGDEVLVEHPGYEPLYRAADGLGAVVRTFDRPEAEGFVVDPDRVAAMVTPRTRAIVVTNLHNPSGVRTADATLVELARIADARGAWLIVNEVYGAFDALADDGVFRSTARNLAPNIIAVGSLTKAYGLGPHRIGWALAPEAAVDLIDNAMISTCGHLPVSHANLGVFALGAIPRLSQRARVLYAGKRALAEAWIRSFPRARWSEPREGLFGFVSLQEKEELLPKIEALREESGVLVGAGTFFGVPNGFRLSWATLPASKFEEGLSLLEPLVR